MTAPDDEPLNVAEVKADEELVEKIRDGETPDDQLGKMLGAWRDEVRPEDAAQRRPMTRHHQWAVAIAVLVGIAAIGAVVILRDLPAAVDWQLVAVQLVAAAVGTAWLYSPERAR